MCLAVRTSFAVPTVLLDRVQPAGGAACVLSLLVRLVLLVSDAICELLFVGLLSYDFVRKDSMVKGCTWVRILVSRTFGTSNDFCTLEVDAGTSGGAVDLCSTLEVGAGTSGGAGDFCFTLELGAWGCCTL